jgi:hypothetical protein
MAGERNRLRRAERMHYSVTVRLSLLLGVLLAPAGCVTGVERRPTNAEAAREAPPPPADQPHAGQIVSDAPRARPDPTPSEPLGPGFIWVRGYWRWDGVRHVWQKGRWERARPGYVRPLPR